VEDEVEAELAKVAAAIAENSPWWSNAAMPRRRGSGGLTGSSSQVASTRHVPPAGGRELVCRPHTIQRRRGAAHLSRIQVQVVRGYDIKSTENSRDGRRCEVRASHGRHLPVPIEEIYVGIHVDQQCVELEHRDSGANGPLCARVSSVRTFSTDTRLNNLVTKAAGGSPV